MTDLHLTRHAIVRMGQRGIQAGDIPWILAIATEVPDGFLVTDKDVAAFERQLKTVIQRLRHLRGKRLVSRDDALVTAFHATKRQAHNLIRSQSR